jgi:hypothetical protein
MGLAVRLATLAIPRTQVTDDEERAKDDRIGTRGWPRSSSFGAALDVFIMPPGENPVANCTNDGPLDPADNKKGYRTLKAIPRVKNCN